MLFREHFTDDDFCSLFDSLRSTHRNTLAALLEINRKNLKSLSRPLLAQSTRVPDLKRAELLHLLLLFPTADIVNLINEKLPDFSFFSRLEEKDIIYDNLRLTRYGLFPLSIQRYTLPENLARMMLDSYQENNQVPELERILKQSSGSTLFDRTLHYVIRQTPQEVVRSLVRTNPFLTDTIMNRAGLRKYCDYDASHIEAIDEIASSILCALGKRFPKHLFSLEKYLADTEHYLYSEDRDGQANHISEMGRTIEKLLLEIILFSHTIHGDPMVWDMMMPFKAKEKISDISEKFNTLGIQSKDSLYQVDTARWSLHDMQMILANLTRLTPPGEFVDIGDRASRYREISSAFNRLGINRMRNAGAHYEIPDRNPSRVKYKEYIQQLREFITLIKNSGIYPDLYHLHSFAKVRDLPFKLTFTDMNGNQREFYFSSDPSADEAEVYAILDMTKNRISINPIIVRWF
jgi:hypothetical protein